MQIVVAAVGKLKERYWREAQAEYLKRLSAYARIDVVEVEHTSLPAHPGDAEIAEAQRTEGARLAGILRDRDGVIALDRSGRTYTSEAWSQQYEKLQLAGYGRLAFLLGGSHGLDADLLNRAALKWSFGPMTLPHELARIVLLEQLYRGEKILRGEPYHK
ncbi:23S rRNA (pseudouridine(1915)-N(3))-methyltransferase RlmH [Alicyclobacillus cycloheptanicus]|uniref:Ribosomal RNA large subunit methyltransferase H n=1 Tax=Alicyclobacillus cycloheptanicus TaxID=1457 RepID=A0ABT9XKT2_9BACL|nr:23S rRNA (pseudouridine(1915)-N(3))-methyltransferase RlmH [Alicyclobacillus cycloheptanicus]MDQ0190919.1 23S rRNA (pseudouridine1915-N3)-methyltransferase [Alicyclobacillus cycloheptanicus]WDM02371.1 23S rRNA (pseudouridine(1915)-N(3))-methyltransferase RlmH [Alicyclobacillus cycloheptanicus]